MSRKFIFFSLFFPLLLFNHQPAQRSKDTSQIRLSFSPFSFPLLFVITHTFIHETISSFTTIRTISELLYSYYIQKIRRQIRTRTFSPRLIIRTLLTRNHDIDVNGKRHDTK